jgi:hypothetical protein
MAGATGAAGTAGTPAANGGGVAGGSAGATGGGGPAGLAGGGAGATGVGGVAGMSAVAGSGGATTACGDVGQACCAGNTCTGDLNCLNGTTCSCVRALAGRYVIRTDGALLYQSDPSSTAQTPVLDSSTGLPLVNMTSVQEGGHHGCAVQSTTKTAWCWRTNTNGYGNAYGQLGNGTTDTLKTVFQASQVLTSATTVLEDVVAIADTEVPYAATGAGSSCAVTGGGNLYCWGTLRYLTNGGTTLTSAFAVPITTDGATKFSGVLQVGLHAEGSWACAIVQGASEKELWCWGYNGRGNLGLGDTTLRRYPTRVLGIANPIKVLARDGNGGTTCVLDGTQVRCWGSNVYGQTGNGTTNSPVQSPSLVTLMGGATPLDNVADFHGGDGPQYANYCALTAGKTLMCWGYGLQTYPTDFGVTSVAQLGGPGNYFRYLTSDGLYHHGTTTNHVGTTRVPSCGPLH